MAPGRVPQVVAVGVAIVTVLVLAGVGAGSGRLIHTHAVKPPSQFGDFVSPPPTTHSPEPIPRATGTIRERAALTSRRSLSTGFLDVLLVVVAGLLVLIVLSYALAARGWRRTRVAFENAADPDSEREQLLKQTADAQVWLETEDDPRRAVIGCWLRLEEMAQRAGSARTSGETAGELTLRVLGEWSIDPVPLQQLRARFEVARFSDAPVDADDLATARSALAAVTAGLQFGTSSRALATFGAQAEVPGERGTT